MDHTLFSSAFSRTLPQADHNLPRPQSDLITHSSFSSPMTCGTHSLEIHHGFPQLSLHFKILVQEDSSVTPNSSIHFTPCWLPLIIWVSAQRYILKEAFLVTAANVVLLCLQSYPPANHSQFHYNLHGLGMCLAASNNCLINGSLYFHSKSSSH